ncbi:MAG: hypothetical protein WDM92_06730 [Caulobacteraceae bacterium]
MTVDPIVRIAFAAAIVDLFWVAVCIAVLGFLAILMVPELPLRARGHAEPVAEPGEAFIEPDEAPVRTPAEA